MQVSNTVAGPPVHPGRGGGRPAAAPPAETKTQGGPTAVVAEEGDEPKGPGRSHAALQHAAEQGEGHKHGLHKRLDAIRAAQQYQTELGLTSPTEAGEAPPDTEAGTTTPDPGGAASEVDAGDAPADQSSPGKTPVTENETADTGAVGVAAPESPVAESPVDADGGEHAAPEALDPISLDLPAVEPMTSELLDTLDEGAAAPNEPEQA